MNPPAPTPSPPPPAAAAPRDLFAAARDRLLLPDRQRLASWLHQLEQRHRAGQPAARAAATFAEDLARAQARWQARQGWGPMLEFPAALPISAQRDRLLAALQQHQVLIVCGDTGSGKTTQLPKIALLAGGGRAGRIGITQPRRLAAVSMARRVAEELHADLGRHVGYQVRFDDQTTAETALKFMTDGILLAETRQDRQLWQYDTLILDEAHERSLNIDFLLGYLKNLLPQRPDLKLIISSATIDPESFARFFDGAPVLLVEGRGYPIEDLWFPPLGPDEEPIRHVARAVRWIDELDSEGDILVFLPGEREIRDAADLLRGRPLPNTEILPLFGRLSLAEQQRVFTVGGRRRIVLATNVAETSITIPGIRYVIDSGLVRLNRYLPRRQIQSLQIEPVSQASARQRRGRCGRVAAGVCVHLSTEESLQQSAPFTDPEIRRASLAGVILQMAALRLPPIEEFPFIDPPSRPLVELGYRTLFEIGALDAQHQLTPLGQELAEFPLDPQLARMIRRARDEHVVPELLVLAAALTIQDPRERPLADPRAADAAHARWRDERSDFSGLLRLWNGFQAARRSLPTANRLRRWCKANYLSYRRILEWQNLVRELADLVNEHGWNIKPPGPVHDDSFYDRVHRAILAGIPLQLGFRQETREYRSARGPAFYIFPGSALFEKAPPWLVAFALVETSKLYARVVGEIDPSWVEQVAPHLCRAAHADIQWDAEQGFVYARQIVTAGELTLLADRRVHYGRIDPAAAREVFLREAMVAGNLRSRHPWLRDHHRLIDEIRVLEHKVRRPHGLLNEPAIYAHFHRVVPPDVCSTKALDDWLQRDQPAIAVPRATAIARPSDPVRPEDWPDTLTVQGQRFSLRYRCAPGEADDGITLSCPADQLPSLPPWAPDWLVPGALPERVRLLIRTLPKELWTACQPLPETADEFLVEINQGRLASTQPLAAALAAFLRDRRGLPVKPEQFAPDKLPEHLILKVAVVDAAGKLLRVVRGRPAEVGYSSQLPERADWLPREWNRHGWTDWTGPVLPDAVLLPAAAGAGGQQGYPALVDEGETAGLRLFLDAAEARRQHAAGLMRLFRLRAADLVARFQKNLPVPPSVQLALLALRGERGSALDDFVELLLEEIARGGGPEYPRDPAVFRQRVDAARTTLFDLAAQRGGLVARLMEQRGAVHQAAEPLRKNAGLAPALADIDRQLAFLFRPGFLRDADLLAQYPRYLKALQVRLDRLRLDPAKDRTKSAAVRPFQQQIDARWAKLAGQPPAAALLRFAALLQEFRVAQFAQELGTAEKVSPQRLQAAWAALG